MSEEKTTSEGKTNIAAVPHVLTVLVDLSHPNFTGGAIRARVALAEVLSGLARAAVRGADATLVQDAEGKTLGVYMIAADASGEGRVAFDMAVGAVLGKDFQEAAVEMARYTVPA